MIQIRKDEREVAAAYFPYTLRLVPVVLESFLDYVADLFRGQSLFRASLDCEANEKWVSMWRTLTLLGIGQRPQVDRVFGIDNKLLARIILTVRRCRSSRTMRKVAAIYGFGITIPRLCRLHKLIMGIGGKESANHDSPVQLCRWGLWQEHFGTIVHWDVRNNLVTRVLLTTTPIIWRQAL